MAPRNWSFNLKSNSPNYPDHGHHGDPPPTRKNSHGRAGNRTRDLVVSNQKLWPPYHEAGQNINLCILNSGFPHIGAERQITRRNILVEHFWINHVEIQVPFTRVHVWVQQALAWLITNLCLNIPFCGNVRSLIHNRLPTQPNSYVYQYSAIIRTAKTFNLSVIFTVRYQLLQ